MNRKRPIALAIAVLCALVLAGGTLAGALSGYALPWWSVNSSGGRAASSNRSLVSSLGQAGVGQSSNAVYRLSAGFWGRAGPLPTETATPTLSPSTTPSPSATASATPTATLSPLGTWLPMIVQSGGG